MADFTDWKLLLRQIGCDASRCNCTGKTNLRRQLADVFDGTECFSIGFHGMMDASCFDAERARHCCVHKLIAEGKLIVGAQTKLTIVREYD